MFVLGYALNSPRGLRFGSLVPGSFFLIRIHQSGATEQQEGE